MPITGPALQGSPFWNPVRMKDFVCRNRCDLIQVQRKSRRVFSLCPWEGILEVTSFTRLLAEVDVSGPEKRKRDSSPRGLRSE